MAVVAVDTAVGRLFVDARDRSLGKTLIKDGHYEPHWTAWLRSVVGPGQRIVDVGANIGYYTVLFATCVGPTGRVVACEPDPGNRALLMRNVEEGGLAAQVIVTDVALADRTGTITLHRDPERSGVHSISRANLVAHAGRTDVTVSVMTLDELMSRHHPRGVDVIKMDAQGAEALILRGATQALTGNAPLKLIVEIWPAGLDNCGTSLEELLAPLEGAGLVPHLIDKHDGTLRAKTFDALRRRAERLAGPQAAFNAAFIR